MSTQNKEILSMQDSINYIRTNFKAQYPKENDKRHTFGNIPSGLHSDILNFAEEHNMHIAEALASLWDFHKEYEAEFQTQLAAQKANTRRRT